MRSFMVMLPGWPAIFDHIVTALCCFIIMLVVGGGLGYLIAKLILHWGQKHPAAPRFLTLIPWRSIVIFTAMFLIRNPAFIIQRQGMGISSRAEYLIISLALITLFIPWIARAFLKRWQPGLIKDDPASTIRTFLMLALVLPAFLFTGVGNFIETAYGNGEYDKVILGNVTIGLIMLVVDLVYGITRSFSRRSQN